VTSSLFGSAALRTVSALPLTGPSSICEMTSPLEELYLLYRRAFAILAKSGVRVHRPYVGEYATSLEMAGASITVMKLDDELQVLIDAPAASPFFTQQGRPHDDGHYVTTGGVKEAGSDER